jgi:hypothetical protein
LLENPLEIGGRVQAAGSGKTMAGRLQASDSQLLAAFGAARVQDGAAATGFHAGAKAVGAYTLDFAGLIGSFHRFCLLLLREYKDMQC